jgi:hypothetical protein
LPIVEKVERGERAEARGRVNADLGAVGESGERAREGRRAERHVLVVRLVGRGAQRRELGGWRAAAAGDHARVVVLHLVVVPDDEPGTRRVHRPQVGIGLVERVARAELVERADVAAGRHAHRVLRVRILVDVVAEEQDDIRVVAAHVLVRAEEAVLPPLAGR